MEVFKRKVQENREKLSRVLKLDKEFMLYLIQVGLLDIMEYSRLQQIKDDRDRRQTFFEIILAKPGKSAYALFIDSLLRTDQSQAVHLVMDIREEMVILAQSQIQLDTLLKEMESFLQREERRSGIYLTETPDDEDVMQLPVTEKDVWVCIQKTIKDSDRQLRRSKAVIEKLHKDCETVAKMNSEIIEQSRVIDARIQDIVSRGRKSAKIAPKKTQDIFSGLMNDVEKLMHHRKSVLDPEIYGKRHYAKIISQCRDWIEDRTQALTNLQLSPGLLTYGFSNAVGDRRKVVKINEIPVRLSEDTPLPMSDSLQMLKRDLQQYIHLELSLSDKYKHDLEEIQLQKQTKGFTPQGIADALAIIDLLRKEPENARHHVLMLRTFLEDIAREYQECVESIDKLKTVERAAHNVDSTSSSVDLSISPKIHRRAQQLQPEPPAQISKRVQSEKQIKALNIDGSLLKFDATAEQKRLLTRIRSLVAKCEEFVFTEQSSAQRFRSEMKKNKKEWHSVLQKKESDIHHLQVRLKEAESEKEKYLKLYNEALGENGKTGNEK